MLKKIDKFLRYMFVLFFALGLIVVFADGKIRAFLENFQDKEYVNYIYYHCADWGPNEDSTNEKIYFVKQIMFYENREGIGNAVYFCSMNPDGSDKKELAKLFENTKLYIDMHPNTSFMDICYPTKQAAIAFSAGYHEQTGLWVINLDGTGFKRIVEQKWSKKFEPRTNHPSWFPDGKQLVYEERWTHEDPSQFYIIKISSDGKNKTYLTSKDNGGNDNRFPVVSPDGTKIAYTHSRWKSEPDYDKQTESGLYLMNADGNNKRMLYDNYNHCANYPEWSPDGDKLYVAYYSDFTLVDAVTGKELFSQLLKFNDKGLGVLKCHWSAEYGYIFDGAGDIGRVTKDLSSYIFLKAVDVRVQTEKKKDLSKNKYRWG